MADHLSEKRTETLILDLLDIQGWSLERPPKGCLVRQNEYKAYNCILERFGKNEADKWAERFNQ